jgi:hypothetical protein
MIGWDSIVASEKVMAMEIYKLQIGKGQTLLFP